MTATKTTKKDQTLATIAANVLDVRTLERRNRDHLDFYTLSVWRIEQALNAAYEAGKASR